MLIQLLFVMLAAVNIAAYFLMWKDKVRAVRHGWRISENTFFLLSLLGGFIGISFLNNVEYRMTFSKKKA
nr:DUF1294 domain-containing protein [uncultured Haemophilus sp.]